MTLGSSKYKYERVEGWAKVPEYFEFNSLGEAYGLVGGVVDVAVDSQDRVYAFCRGNHPVLIFDRDGKFLSCWGEGHFVWPHAIFIAPDDSVFVVDGGAHTVEKFSLAGEELMTLGHRNCAIPIMRREPFTLPTAVAVGPTGEIFCSNGYANFLIHKFSPEGKLLKTWGEPGKGPGQFALPHYIAADRYGMLYVCDRQNNRVQLFDSEGQFRGEWTDFHRPQAQHIDWKNDLIYTVESWHQPDPQQPKITVRDLDGHVLSEFGGREREGKGPLEVGHGICVDSHGDIYESEIRDVCRIQKFARPE